MSLSTDRLRFRLSSIISKAITVLEVSDSAATDRNLSTVGRFSSSWNKLVMLSLKDYERDLPMEVPVRSKFHTYLSKKPFFKYISRRNVQLQKIVTFEWKKAWKM